MNLQDVPEPGSSAGITHPGTYQEVLDDATPLARVDPRDLGVSEDELRRLKAFRYLSSPDRPLYLVIMRLFTSVLLAEWSAQDVADRLAADGVVVDPDIVDAKLKQLVTWGNLLPSPREVRVSSIAEYHRQSARFQVSKLGTEVQRVVDETLAAAEGAREVSRELLALVSRGLDELADIARRQGAAADPEDLAGRVSNLFLQFGEFAASISDFYAYVGSVVSRFDLDSDEFNGFKSLLLDYLESVVGEVALHTPAVEQALTRLWPQLPALLAVLEEHGAEFRALQEAQPGASVDRARGRALRDWEELRAWFSEVGATSGAYQLRSAANRALSALLANLKRINAATSRATSHRRDLLKLARWFTDSTPEEAHTLFNAAYAMHGSRHLGVALGDDGQIDPELVRATTPWWKAPTAPVPVSLRERGDRAARGRSSKPIDYGREKQLLLARHEEVRRARQAACDELAAAASRLSSVRISVPAMDILVELFASATAAATLDTAGGRTRFETGSSTVDDTGLILTVRRDDGRTTTIRSTVGEITLIDLALTLVPTAAAADARQEQA